MKKRTRAEAFNEWLRRAIENPTEFDHAWQGIVGFLRETAAGEEPSYGAACAAFLAKLEAGE